MSSPRSANQVIAEIAIIIRKEMKQICSESRDSVIRDSQEGIKHFKWERVWTELVNHMPTLMKLLSAIFLNQKATQNICSLIACMILKKRLGKMSMVQKALSVLLYGNGCNKQVCDM